MALFFRALLFLSIVATFNHVACATRVELHYPILRPPQPDQALSQDQKRRLRQAVIPWLGAENDKLFPGASVLVARNGQVLFREGFGVAQYQNGKAIKVTENTIFDLASLTKVVATTAAIMQLVSEKQLSLNSTLRDLLPGFRLCLSCGTAIAL